MKKKNPWLGFFLLLVRMTGFEPAQDCSHMDLNHTCLPFHHIREFNIKFMFLARFRQPRYACHPSCKMGRPCLLQAPSFVQDTPPRCIVHRTRSALYPFHHIRSFVATRTCLTLSIANARVRLSCVRLLLFICEFCFKILDEHACAWI